MIKNITKLCSAVLCSAFILSSSLSVFANGTMAIDEGVMPISGNAAIDSASNNVVYYDLEVDTRYEVDAEVPLTTEASTDVFYVNKNINPGDILESSIIMTNQSTEEAIQMTISDIENLLGDDDIALALLDILILTIEADGRIIYQGPHSQTTQPVIAWIEVAPQDSIEVKITVEFPKEADNTYQNAPMKVLYKFESRLDIPDDWTYEPPEDPFDEEVQTGEHPVQQALNTLGLVIGFLLLLMTCTFVMKLSKKSKSN